MRSAGRVIAIIASPDGLSSAMPPGWTQEGPNAAWWSSGGPFLWMELCQILEEVGMS